MNRKAVTRAAFLTGLRLWGLSADPEDRAEQIELCKKYGIDIQTLPPTRDSGLIWRNPEEFGKDTIAANEVRMGELGDFIYFFTPDSKPVFAEGVQEAIIAGLWWNVGKRTMMVYSVEDIASIQELQIPKGFTRESELEFIALKTD